MKELGPAEVQRVPSQAQRVPQHQSCMPRGSSPTCCGLVVPCRAMRGVQACEGGPGPTGTVPSILQVLESLWVGSCMGVACAPLWWRLAPQELSIGATIQPFMRAVDPLGQNHTLHLPGMCRTQTHLTKCRRQFWAWCAGLLKALAAMVQLQAPRACLQQASQARTRAHSGRQTAAMGSPQVMNSTVLQVHAASSARFVGM